MVISPGSSEALNFVTFEGRKLDSTAKSACADKHTH